MLNRRVLEDLKSQWWEYDRVKCDKIEDESDGISIYNIGGVFLVIFIGKFTPLCVHKHVQPMSFLHGNYGKEVLNTPCYVTCT